MFDWNEDKLNPAKELANKKISYAKIAKELGTSKNSVIGKIFRDRVKCGHKPFKPIKRKEHETTTHFTKHGISNCWVCKKPYTTYSKFDRFCSPCKTRDYFRNVI